MECEEVNWDHVWSWALGVDWLPVVYWLSSDRSLLKSPAIKIDSFWF